MNRMLKKMSNYLQEWEESLDTRLQSSSADRTPASPELDEFLWQKIKSDYQTEEYEEDDLRSEFNKIVQDWLNKGALVKKNGKIRMN
ncbi:MAG: hypothetical protein IJD04_03495 [Desulfovibrionaceae bacterium]|nr:hypothetical protein [Desulfovibrionaceae bacterium]